MEARLQLKSELRKVMHWQQIMRSMKFGGAQMYAITTAGLKRAFDKFDVGMANPICCVTDETLAELLEDDGVLKRIDSIIQISDGFISEFDPSWELAIYIATTQRVMINYMKSTTGFDHTIYHDLLCRVVLCTEFINSLYETIPAPLIITLDRWINRAVTVKELEERRLDIVSKHCKYYDEHGAEVTKGSYDDIFKGVGDLGCGEMSFDLVTTVDMKSRILELMQKWGEQYEVQMSGAPVVTQVGPSMEIGSLFHSHHHVYETARACVEKNLHKELVDGGVSILLSGMNETSVTNSIYGGLSASTEGLTIVDDFLPPAPLIHVAQASEPEP